MKLLSGLQNETKLFYPLLNVGLDAISKSWTVEEVISKVLEEFEQFAKGLPKPTTLDSNILGILAGKLQALYEKYACFYQNISLQKFLLSCQVVNY